MSGARPILAAGALLAGLAVALGAFGAHGLRGLVGPAEIGWWQTAALYHMVHALGLLALGASGRAEMGAPAMLLGAGTILFSGSLYVMALTGAGWLGPVTPLGGLLLIAGWALAAWRFVRG